jgi:uncharacterized protein YcbX
MAWYPFDVAGFKWDRMWMVVNSKGRMLTQRVNPELALVEVSLPEEALYMPKDSLSPDSALSRVYCLLIYTNNHWYT